MLDKMSPNQRLIVAVLLSVIFFVGYTAIFPPVESEVVQDTKVQIAQSSAITVPSVNVEAEAGHVISAVETSSSNNLVTVSNEHFILKIDTLGRISSKELLEEKFRDKEDKHAQLIPSSGTKPLYIRFMDENLNKEASSVAYTASVNELNIDGSAKSVTLSQKLSSLTVQKKITFFDDGHYNIAISLSEDKRYYVYLGQRPRVNEEEQMMTVVGAMVYTDDEIVTIIADGDAEGSKSFSGVALLSAFDQYTATIMYGLSKDRTIIVERDTQDNPVVYFDGTQNIEFSGYIGQKNYKKLESINPILTNAIEYGWFTFAAKPLFALLSWLHGIFGNWGWSIIALTAIIRFVLYPLTYKGMVSMQKMKDLAPKIKELKEKYKGDPQRLNQATMDMYKKNGANPLGGCLPMLMQIPVFFAIYRVLLNAVELQGAPWILWVNDLSRMDPYYVMPVLMGASMFLQQRMTPNNFSDPMQEKVMKWLPVIFTFFFVTFPSGLVLYWFVNNLFSILQQFIVNQQFKNAKDALKAAKVEK
ncbi:MAG: membrane protein insertase YidC [Sulfurimonas sp.]|nr:membrane protein insertase YidC [Sulfurimonas sp.]